VSNPPKSWFRDLASRTETRLLLQLLGLVCCVAAFAAFTSEVLEGDTAAFDRRVLLAFRIPGHLNTPIGPRWLMESARDITALGGFTVLTLVSVGAVIVLLTLHRRRQALGFGASVLIAQALSEAIKYVTARPRPELVTHLDLVYSSSFPSGHATMSPVVYLTLAGVLSAGLADRRQKVVLISCAACLVAAIGVSRVYLGVHWPTDVLGGWALGCLISLAATWAISRGAARPEPLGDHGAGPTSAARGGAGRNAEPLIDRAHDHVGGPFVRREDVGEHRAGEGNGVAEGAQPQDGAGADQH
jgi:undecaprenyl-diphosphatase